MPASIPGIFRLPEGEDRPPRFWRVCRYVGPWERQLPFDRLAVVLGLSERKPPVTLYKGTDVRVYPVSGEWPQDFPNLTAGVRWLEEAFLRAHPGARFELPHTIPGELLVKRKQLSRSA